MRYLFIIFALLSYQNPLAAQCNCEKTNRDDGTVVNQCIPLPVSSDNTTQIGLSVASNGKNKFITLTVRFKETAMRITSKITFRLSDNNMFSLELVNSALSYIGNSQVASAIFLMTDFSEILLKNSTLMTVSFTLTDDLIHTYKVDMNADIIKTQLQCL